MHQIALALRNYADTHGAYPPAYTTDANGKPLHSWRTLILPYLERKDLYESIDLTKPWDDPVNAAARDKVLSAYQCPSVKLDPSRSTYTTYLAVVTPNSCLRGASSCALAELTDGPEETLLLIEADSAHAVHWMSPSDADDVYVLGIGSTNLSVHPGGLHIALADASVCFMSEETPASQRRALISIAGEDDASIDELR